MKSNKIVFDIEANNLLQDATIIHCICSKNISTGEETNLFDLSLTPDKVLSIFERVDKIIGHNIIGYDIPMIKKFYGIDLIDLLGIEKICDTYILSQLLYPDRKLPKGCPTVIFNPILKTSKKIGPHGLEAWGYRVGYKKIEIHDWRVFDENMLNRCKTDVLINEQVYYELLKEAGIND